MRMTSKLLVALFAVGLVITMASKSQALLATSMHNFGTGGGNWAVGPDGQVQMCVACHTPHNGNILMTDAPLWNHLIRASAGLTPYGNPAGTMDSVAGAITGISLACMSCHDGATNIDAYGGNVGATTIGAVTANLGTNLSNDHPVSITYNTALTVLDTELNDPSGTASGLGGNIDVDMLFGAANNQLECASCHDVHNTAVDAPSGYLLRLPMLDSQLCLTCHAK